MNDWDCITDKQCEAGGLLLGQVRMCDLSVFAGAVASFEHEFKRGGLLYDFYRKDESLHEAVFERYRDAMGLMVVACCREQVAETLDMLAAADAVLKLNQPFFMRERHADDGKTNWFDGVQALLVCGHDLAAVQHVNWENVFPLGVVFAIVGGVLGAAWASLHDDDKWQQAVAEVVIASVLAAAIAEYQLPLNMIWVCAAGGVFAGLITGHLLDAVSAAAPNFIKALIGKMADKYAPKMKGSDDV